MWSWIPNLFQLLKHTWSSPQALESLSLNCVWLNFVVLALLLTEHSQEEPSEAETLTVTVILFLLNGVVLSGFLWHMGIELQHMIATACCHRHSSHSYHVDDEAEALLNDNEDDSDVEQEMLLVAGEQDASDDDDVGFVGVNADFITPEQQVRHLRRELRSLQQVDAERQRETETLRHEIGVLKDKLKSL